jgi:hypothetical protein
MKRTARVLALLCLVTSIVGCSPAARARLNRAAKGGLCGVANTPPPNGPEGAGGGISRTAQGVEKCQNQ